jgi:transcriptional regulator with XRE-family HTH domain
MKLADKLVYLRKKQGLSQLKLAEMMNVSRQAISRWETGIAVPSAENLKYLGNLYNVSLDYLFNDDVDELEENEKTPEEIAEISNNGKKHSKKRKTKWVIILCFVLLAVAIYIFVRVGAGSKSTQIKKLPNEEVDIAVENGFDIG